MHPGQMIVIAARPGVGKALSLDTPLPTPTGWTTMGEVAVGDELIGADGKPTRVVAATDVMHGRPCYRVAFSDGTEIVADEAHQWLTETRASRKSAQAAAVQYNRYKNQRTFAAVRTTREIAETLRCPTADRRLNHSVSNAKPLQGEPAELPVPPYTLGAWLGDGTTAAAQITSADPEIVMRIEAEGFVEGTLQARLRTLGVLGNKHIPLNYLRASEEQRRALLAGLLDTDGTVTAGGAIQFSVTNQRLASDVHELIVSLGYRCHTTTKRVKGRTEQSSTAYTLNFSTDDEVFGLTRKALIHKDRRRSVGTARTCSRFIVDVEPIQTVPVRCVQVDNADHMYLASRAMVPTHNSTLGLDFLRSCSIKNRMSSVIFSLEMSKSEIVMRLLSAEAKIKLADMRSGRMSDDDWTRLARRMSEISEAPLLHRRFAEHDDDGDPREGASAQAEARSGLDRHRLSAADDIGQEGRVPSAGSLRILAADQAFGEGARGAGGRDEPAEPRSGAAHRQEAHVVGPSRVGRDRAGRGHGDPDAPAGCVRTRRSTRRRGRPDLAKHRNGPTKTVTVAHQLHLSRFTNMAK